jgi:hypothetical protein
MKMNDAGLSGGLRVGNADFVGDGLGTRAGRGMHLRRDIVVLGELRWSDQAFVVSEDEPTGIPPERRGAGHDLSEAVATEADHASSGQSKTLGRKVLAGPASHNGASGERRAGKDRPSCCLARTHGNSPRHRVFKRVGADDNDRGGHDAHHGQEDHDSWGKREAGS